MAIRSALQIVFSRRRLCIKSGLGLAGKAVIGMGTIVILGSHSIPGQTAVKGPTFEVATIKPAAPEDLSVRSGGYRSTGFSASVDPGRIAYRNISLKRLILRAYRLRDYQVSGPSWLDEEHYDVTAKLPEGIAKQEIPEMLQFLLTERFRMRVHWEDKAQRIYALMVGQDRPRLKESKEIGEANAADGAPPLASRLSFSANGKVDMTATTMSALAEFLSKFLDRPVIDLTGIAGYYDISLGVSMDDMTKFRSGVALPEGMNESGVAAVDNGGPGSIIAAVRELGLKLEPKMGTIRRIVVDEAERVPIEN
jgi:uncharacterized protein (TIGR03435 family)